MHRFATVSFRLTALVFVTSLGTVSAYAQQSQSDDSMTFSMTGQPSQAAPAARPATGGVALRPIAPPPSVVLDLATEPSGGFAKIIPPAPKVAARGPVVISRPSGAYSTKLAAASSALKVNSNFGYRRDPFTGRGRRHTGVDIDGEWGESVGTSLAGTISFAGVKRGYGNIVIVDHGQGLSTYYAHLSSMTVGVGQAVAAGQTIGFVGSTGRSTGPHLHYEVRAYGYPVNPSATIALDGSRVFVDGKPLQNSTVVESWGDEPEPATVIPAGGSAAAATSGSRPRRAAKPGVNKHVLVYDENSLTEY